MDWRTRLTAALGHGRGVRFGEAAVVSRRVHTYDPGQPGRVSILTHADAGRVFYGRARADEILHLDLFHAVGEVDHRRVAAVVRRVCAALNRPRVADHCDVQTGTGGGRVTGSLTYGRRPGLLASHRNHIHLAVLLANPDLDLLPRLVAALEEEAAAAGLGPRRIEALSHFAGGGDRTLDLSHYADNTDSLLRESGAGPGNPRPGTGGGAAGQGEAGGGAAGQGEADGGAAGQGEADGGAARHGGGAAAAGGSLGARAGGAAGQGSGGAAAAGGGAAGGGGAGAGAARAGAGEAAPGAPDPMQIDAALQLARQLGSPEELKRVLDAVRSGQATPGNLFGSGTQGPYLVRQLEEAGLVRRDGRGIRITEAGQSLAFYFERHLKEIKMRFRRLIRRVPRQVLSARPTTAERASPDVRHGPVRGVAPVPPGGRAGDLAVTDTVLAGLKRTRLARLSTAETDAPPSLVLRRQDLHVRIRAGQQPLYICLLIDASASMAGRRIQAAKYLVRHLLASTRDRIAVVAFQERDVRVHVPFTRDWSLVEEGLGRVQPAGLTPLAHGLTAGLELVQQARVRRPLLLLITDGIPTVPKWTIDPLADALAAARRFRGSRVPFGCIGLMPSRRYLEELAATAGGSLHVVEELHEEALVTIAHRERWRLHARRR